MRGGDVIYDRSLPYVSTVRLNEATIRKYLQEQEGEDIMRDKMSAKEYENPFKGQR